MTGNHEDKNCGFCQGVESAIWVGDISLNNEDVLKYECQNCGMTLHFNETTGSQLLCSPVKYFYEEEESEVSVSTSDWTTHLELTFQALSNEEYKIEVSFEIDSDVTGYGNSRVLVDDVEISYQQEISDYWNMHSAIKVVKNKSGTVSVKTQARDNSLTGTVNIRRSRIFVQRIK